MLTKVQAREKSALAPKRPRDAPHQLVAHPVGYVGYPPSPSGRLLCEVNVPKWAPVVAFDEEKNALGLSQAKLGELEQEIEWVNLRLFTTGKLRLSPPKEQASS